MRRYEGSIEFWEVVNEPAHLPGIPIDNPYRWAREVSPEAHLIVNDYGVLADSHPLFLIFSKSQPRWRAFDGMGFQAHDPRDMAFPLDRVQNILDRYATLGKKIHITEFTPQSNWKKVTGSPWRDVWNEAQQADYADKFYRVCFAHPAVMAITWWDLSDQGSWLQSGGMLRADLSPKPVYETLKKLIRKEWHTSLQGQTDSLGHFQFSGLYGVYRVTLRKNNLSKTALLHLTHGTENVITYELDQATIAPPAHLKTID